MTIAMHRPIIAPLATAAVLIRAGAAVTEDRLISRGFHHQYGWLRRKELDGEEGYCYEQPDGDLVYSSYFCHRNKMVLQCKQDAKTGEKYLCLSQEDPLVYEITVATEKLKRWK